MMTLMPDAHIRFLPCGAAACTLPQRKHLFDAHMRHLAAVGTQVLQHTATDLYHRKRVMLSYLLYRRFIWNRKRF